MWASDVSEPHGPLARMPGKLCIPSLLFLCIGLICVKSSALNCHTTCTCYSNIVSCSKKELLLIPSGFPHYTVSLDLSHNSLKRLRADWAPVPLKRLHSLLLNHNKLTFISTDAFSLVAHLKHLDLSSNELKTLDENLFSKLKELEVLLLYNNAIVKIDRTAFDDMQKLQKLYLSQNQISRFPLQLVKDSSKLPELVLLDLSSNRLKTLPIRDLKGLPAWVKNGLYLHSNPLTCDCELYGLFTHWHIRQLTSVVDFREELICTLLAYQKETVSVFSLLLIMNCSEIKESDMEAYVGKTVTMDCDSKQRGMSQAWLTPNNDLIAPESKSSNQTLTVLSNGSLQIRPVRAEDRGVYTCHASSIALNETLYVTLVVYNATQHDTLNTAYTTLVGCIASVILVLIYLYLTPCRCWCRTEEKQRNENGDSIHSSVLSTTPNHDTASDKVALNRHVAFIKTSTNLQLQISKPNGQEAQHNRGIQKPQRKMSDPGSASSVFSDTPIMV
ncbi:amphoterin-induced protein 1 [Rhinatrema bivittatum]|uniref:amphoterin-induced protein 1 n=1 Tax=Rhinatrema bivittatum TaxID=194408 RepID=UPI00112BF308|nr:amphoterin-induced protein 1 [Rhinatrema bivittatum]